MAVNRPLARTFIAAEALNYSQIIMTVVFGPRTKQHQTVRPITRSFILLSIIDLFALLLMSERNTFWAVRRNQ